MSRTGRTRHERAVVLEAYWRSDIELHGSGEDVYYTVQGTYKICGDVEYEKLVALCILIYEAFPFRKESLDIRLVRIAL